MLTAVVQFMSLGWVGGVPGTVQPAAGLKAMLSVVRWFTGLDTVAIEACTWK